jgi:carboxypeptidase Q
VARGNTRGHREAYAFGPSWTRGIASGRLLAPGAGALSLAQMGWSPATAGPVRGDAMLVTARNDAEMQALFGTFRGRILLLGDMPPLSGPGVDTAAALALRMRVVRAMRDEGALAVLLPSGRETGLNMTGSPTWRRPLIPVLPVAFVETRDYERVHRALLRGERVPLELNLPGTLSPAPVQAFNTVAELRGSERPDEVVVIGAHIDSWDLGTGATDNGTGVAAAMEALRAIQAAGLHPGRTVRVVLFSGEEQGLWGSKAYVAAHAAEMDRIQAVLIDDLGTGRVRGWALQAREDLRPFVARAIAPLNDIGVRELPLERSSDSDHAPFVEAGVPAFFAVQDTVDYFATTHHSQYDTFDHVRPADLLQGAGALAVTAWELANMPERLPHAAPARRP